MKTKKLHPFANVRKLAKAHTNAPVVVVNGSRSNFTPAVVRELVHFDRHQAFLKLTWTVSQWRLIVVVGANWLLENDPRAFGFYTAQRLGVKKPKYSIVFNPWKEIDDDDKEASVL